MRAVGWPLIGESMPAWLGNSDCDRGFLTLLAGVVLVGLLGWVDYVTGREVSFSIFYLLPVSLVAWCVGAGAGVLIALLGGLSWYAADLLNEAQYSHWVIPVWNAVMRFLLFCMLAGLLSRLKVLVRRERAARKAAEEATRARSDFLANLSHEIRTPLNAMVGVTDLLADTPLAEEQRRYLAVFRAEGSHLRRLVNEVLDFSKLEAGRLELERVAFSLRALLENVAQSMAGAAGEKGLEFRAQAAGDLGDVWVGDSHRLRQVLLNLAGNAVKFTDHGSVEVLARRALDAEGPGAVLFSVSDSGVGIAPELRAGLFERFAQADRSVARKYGGSGLGLSISKRLVELMGGGGFGWKVSPARARCFTSRLSWRRHPPLSRQLSPPRRLAGLPAARPRRPKDSASCWLRIIRRTR
jgi:signal transduction histidine kinase